MRTTVRLPDELYSRVRRASNARGETVTSFMERALRRALDERDLPPPPPYRVDAFPGGRLRPWVNLDDSDALLEVVG